MRHLSYLMNNALLGRLIFERYFFWYRKTRQRGLNLCCKTITDRLLLLLRTWSIDSRWIGVFTLISIMRSSLPDRVKAGWIACALLVRPTFR
jgi:hypothetical protein